jgi:uncharacterized Fe-S cluster-containing radical SAM superfamily enzyme
MFVNVFCSVQTVFCSASLSDTSQVEVTNFVSAMEAVMRPYVNLVMKAHTQNRKRVGVLISGTGTNLQVSFIGYSQGRLN